MLWALSTSGNSASVVAALQVARALGLHILGLTGQDEGRMAPYCDVLIGVRYRSRQTVQERHLPIYHALCIMVERELFGARRG